MFIRIQFAFLSSAKMRKRPQQQRAKIIVENILEGAQKCISDFGVLQLTTPKIAEKSGVSVGSIYQYFENKEQIEVSKFYEKLPKPHALAVQEWLDDKIYHRDATSK